MAMVRRGAFFVIYGVVVFFMSLSSPLQNRFCMLPTPHKCGAFNKQNDVTEGNQGIQKSIA
jgi:hypothetical protein